MSGSFFHPEWHFISDLKFFIRPEVQVSLHKYKKQAAYVLRNPVSGRVFKVSATAWKLISQFNGLLTLQEIWLKAIKESHGQEQPPSQSETIEAVNSLYHYALIGCHELPDTQKLDERRKSQKLETILQKLKSPLSVKIPIWDPDDFLTRTSSTISLLFFNPFCLVICFSICILALFVCASHFDAITSSSTDQLFALENIISFSLLYPIIKTVHELGHGYTLKHYGGRSHEIGLMFLLFFPVPYIDASESTLFPNKWARFQVAMAGIIVELVIASLAIITWSLLEPGFLKALFFNIFIIAGVSTILFNGNPLLRFDAYYALSDLLETPNLSKEANGALGQAFKYFILFGKKTSAWPSGKLNLMVYAISAFIYRIIIFIVISTYLITNFFFLGVALAILGVYTTLIKPSIWLMKQPLHDPDLRQHTKRTWAAISVIVVGLVYGLFVHPVQWSYSTTAVVKPLPGSEIRAPISGVVQIQPEPKTQVQTNDPLWIIAPARLAYESQRVEAEIDQTKAERKASVKASDRQKFTNTLEFLQNTQADITNKLNSGMVRAHKRGELILLNQVPVEKYFAYQGDLLGYIVNRNDFRLVTQIPELDYTDFKESVSHIEYFIPSTSQRGTTQIISESGRSSNIIAYDQLLIDNGGDLAAQTGPDGSNLSIHNLVELKLTAPTQPSKLDMRVLLRFVQKEQPVAPLLYRILKRNFLSLIDG